MMIHSGYSSNDRFKVMRSMDSNNEIAIMMLSRDRNDAMSVDSNDNIIKR